MLTPLLNRSDFEISVNTRLLKGWVFDRLIPEGVRSWSLVGPNGSSHGGNRIANQVYWVIYLPMQHQLRGEILEDI